MDDFLVDRVLLAVEQVPTGRVVAYGDIATLVGTGPRQVGAVLSRYGVDVPWWRVTGHNGEITSTLVERARRHWDAEGIAAKPNGTGCRIAEHRADQVALRHAYTRALGELLAGAATPLPAIGGPASRALAASGVSNLEQLLDWSRAELAALHGVGPKAVRIIEEALAGQGWRLRDLPGP
jgi:alkylated DNA nucleotide flippase Atl1